MTIQPPGGEEQFPEPFAGFDERPRDTRGLRVVLAGAAGVAVIAGGAAGFIWLGAAPSADASLITPAGSASAAPETTSPPSSFGSGSAFGGRDIFANTVAPTAAAGAGAVDGAQVPVATGAAAGTATGTAAGTASGGAKGGAGTSSGPTSPSGPSRTTKPAAPAPAAPTPTAEVPWTAPDIRLIGADATAAKFWVRDERTTVKPVGTVGRTTTVFDSYFAAQSTKIEEDLNGVKTEKPVTEGYVVLRAGQGVRQGWVLKVPGADADPLPLPDAAVGNTRGTIRVYEIGSYGPSGVGARISVNGASPVVVEVGEQIPGTRFTYQAADVVKAFSYSPLAQEATDYVLLSDDTGRIYFGTPGAGEDAGIRY